jgi:hypothetical protein
MGGGCVGTPRTVNPRIGVSFWKDISFFPAQEYREIRIQVIYSRSVLCSWIMRDLLMVNHGVPGLYCHQWAMAMLWRLSQQRAGIIKLEISTT